MATLTELREELASLKAAAAKITDGAQSYGVGGRSLNRVDYTALQNQIVQLERRIEIVRQSGRIPGSNVVFRG